MSDKTGRNELCPCGSGQKFKQCCGNGNAPKEIVVEKQTTFTQHLVQCERNEDGSIRIAFVVTEGGTPVQHVYNVADEGKKTILDVLTGGLTLPNQS